MGTLLKIERPQGNFLLFLATTYLPFPSAQAVHLPKLDFD
jgi:hypothetical protein